MNDNKFWFHLRDGFTRLEFNIVLDKDSKTDEIYKICFNRFGYKGRLIYKDYFIYEGEYLQNVFQNRVNKLFWSFVIGS